MQMKYKKIFVEFTTRILMLPLQWPQGGLCISLLGVKQHPDPTTWKGNRDGFGKMFIAAVCAGHCCEL